MTGEWLVGTGGLFQVLNSREDDLMQLLQKYGAFGEGGAPCNDGRWRRLF